MQSDSTELKVNEAIRASRVRVIAENGEQLGILDIQEALQIAEDRGFDLVEVSPLAHPPVCKLMDYGKYKYGQKKKAAESRKKQHQMQIKEVKMRPKTNSHDLETKIRHIERFLKNGNGVKLTMRFRGREIMYAEDAMEVLFTISRRVAELGQIRSHPTLEGRNMSMVLVPKTTKK